MGDLADPAVRRLLEEHLADMHATSPPESVHALDHEELADPSLSFWTATVDGEVLGCAGLKELAATAGEVKSMRTSHGARGRGVATELLRHVVAQARSRGYTDLFLETGTGDFFAPAHRLYRRHGFRDCPPFGDYVLDPHSVFMTLSLTAHGPA